MYRPRRPSRPPGSGGQFRQPNQSSPQTSYFYQNPTFQRHLVQNYVGFPSFTPFLQNPTVAPSNPSHDPRELLARAEAAVVKAHQDLVAAGEYASTWKVSQSALLALGMDSWSSMGFQMQDVPYLHRLIVTEGKVDAFIHCFVGVRRITSVHDLDVAICASEGIEQFELLGLGPLLRHPLVVHYFSVPANATEVPKITSEDIVVALANFMDKCKRTISTDDFLNFIKEKHSVTVKEKLGIRIRSLGLYITYIREAKKAENSTLCKSPELLKDILNKKNNDRQELQPCSVISEKVLLDRKFDSISKRVMTFSASMEDLGNSHIRFDSSDDDANTNKQLQSSPQDKDSVQPVSSCPYPSTTEEIVRLGLKNEKRGGSQLLYVEGKMPSNKKRKLKKQNNISNPRPLHEFVVETTGRLLTFASCLQDHFMLKDNALEDFTTTWREICRKNTLIEVLNMMLSYYTYTYPADKKNRKMFRSMKATFSSYPGIGILNVAMACIRCGMLHSSHYDLLESIGKDEFVNQSSVGVTETKALLATEGSEMSKGSMTVGDIVEKISTYFYSDEILSMDKDLPQDKIFALFKRFRECETWLVEQFSVQEFRSLGYGDFLGFLEKNVSLLPYKMHKFLRGDRSQKSLMVASMLKNQLQVFLYHARKILPDKETITGKYVSTLLDKQFPTISFEIVGDEPGSVCSDTIWTKGDSDTSSSVKFSTSLLGKRFMGNSLPFNEKRSPEISGMTSEAVHYDSFLRPSSEDAVKCLMKAPMLSDLYSWSHWDLVYSPSMGSLLKWLLSGIHCKELMCMATRDGKLIRIDHSATAEEFLEAAIQGSSFQAAVKLLSLIYLYGGTDNFPLSLLKHFVKRAFEVMIRNSTDCMEGNLNREGSKYYETFDGQAIFNGDPNMKPLSLSSLDSITVINQGVELQMIQHNALSAVSCFILDCLSHLPSEFRSFAAEILVSGLQAYTKDAYSVVLHECKQPFQRLMLHDIGLCLGVVEWIEDYNAFNLLPASDLITMSSQMLSKPLGSIFPGHDMALDHSHNASKRMFSSKSKSVSTPDSDKSLLDEPQKEFDELREEESSTKISQNPGNDSLLVSQDRAIQDATLLIESIRREEFGLDPNVEYPEDNLLKKQHARLGRALHCLSQELYSQDSHLLLELIQNADDNGYPENVDPSLIFILQANGIVVLNNEQGFTVENIRALCDIGNSTKKGGAGYIGHKGIGFKSVFRVTDAPEIHSNGFHVKFDISDGQIGFVLPTVISPCDISVYMRQLSCEVNKIDAASWKTCIVLPFRSKLKEDAGISSIVSLFSDLHPSLLLFLHRLQCIQYKNMLNSTLIVMRRETLEDGIIRVSHGNEKMSWLVVRQKLQASLIRLDVQTTEIAIAFTLQESNDGEYRPYLSQQPVFAFLPLRQYGLKCILQGDFVLPSSREEVDGDSAWNQWLLSEFPALFVHAEMSFLPCFKNCPGKAVSAFMSFVPLVGEVYGFFSHLPNMILSRLRMSNCLLMEGRDTEWVPPCRVLRGWDEQARLLISDTILEQHLGLGYLRKDIILSDSLARALGIKNYGPKILMEVISSISQTDGAIESLGFDWLSSWLVALNIFFSIHTAGYLPDVGPELDLINNLNKISFIPLSDGSYGSIAEGPIWLPCNSFTVGVESTHNPKIFPGLYKKLRTVNPLLLSAEMSYVYNSEQKTVDNLIRMLHKVGVQQLSAHEIIKTHILQVLDSDSHKNMDASLMVEYVSFVMLHLQYDCPSCRNEKEGLIIELRKSSIILTNHGYKCPMKEPIHFSKEFGNPVNTDRLINNEDTEWHEVDDMYLKHPSTLMLTLGVIRWREFFQAMGVTDFVQVIRVEKNATDFLTNFPATTICDGAKVCSGSVILDWESPELVRLLSKFSSEKHLDKCKYLLEVLDSMWDDCYGAHATLITSNDKRSTESSFMKIIRNIKWIASSTDRELHLPKDVYFDCETVRSVLGASAPYAHPQVSSKELLKDIGFKTQVTLDDALQILQLWRMSDSPFKASIAQISRFYNFIWDNFPSNEGKIRDQFKLSSWIFVPFIGALRQKDAVPGLFLFPNEVYWHDPTGCVNQIKEIIYQGALVKDRTGLACRALDNVYPSLHDFFVKGCGVHDGPSFANYVEILLQLSRVTLPSQSAHAVFRVLTKLADDLKSGIVKSEEVLHLRNSLSELENTVLPTIQDKWVSLHSTFGLVCWSDDEELRIQFKHSSNIYFLHFGQLIDEEKDMLSGKVALLMKAMGVPALSEVVSREAIFYGTADNQEKLLLVNWILPYAQRYINKLNPDTYLHLKQFKLDKLRQLQVFMVEKLYYKHSLKGQRSTSKKRFECHSLLQQNILYTTHSSDSHSLFLELSRVFFDGSANLHLANFLHMITTMVESGSSEEQLELFIINSQKVPKLPVEESPWSLLSVQPVHADITPRCPAPLAIEESLTKVSKKPSINSNWPPTNWKNAPGFGTGLTYRFKLRPQPPSHGSSFMESVHSDQIFSTEDIPVNVNIDEDWTVEDNLTSTAFLLQDSGNTKNQPYALDNCNSFDNETRSGVESKIASDLIGLNGAQNSAPRVDDSLSMQASNEVESYKTGRLGEAAAYRYFSEKLNTVDVKWINKESETGLPYDLLIGENEEDRQYIEVKTTKSKNKNWFPITSREWQFAFEKGDAFSIARVVLMGPKNAQITVLRNPVQLLQRNMLHLAILMS